MTEALFLGFGVLLVASSLMMVLHKNPVTSALFLVVAFCSLAGIYLMLRAEFLGVVQIIVYAGAIMVLFLFVIMYLNLGSDIETGVQIAFRRWIGWAMGALVVTFGIVVVARQWLAGPTPEAPESAIGNTQAIGQILYSKYLFPFEVTSIILLVAIIGAVVIAKGRAPLHGSEAMASARAGRAAPMAPEAKPKAPPASQRESNEREASGGAS